jgi:lipid-A-disaccharide synthase-like uncharacterized protein
VGGAATNGSDSEELVSEIAGFGLHDVFVEARFWALLGVMAFLHCTIRCVLRWSGDQRRLRSDQAPVYGKLAQMIGNAGLSAGLVVG